MIEQKDRHEDRQASVDATDEAALKRLELVGVEVLKRRSWLGYLRSVGGVGNMRALEHRRDAHDVKGRRRKDPLFDRSCAETTQ